MNCIVIGLSNFGIELAKQLTDLGHEVLGVDANLTKVNTYKDDIKNTIQLNIDGENAARNLPLKDADVVFVTVRKDFGASILIVAILQKIGVKRIVACSISDIHSMILQAMQISEIIRPEKEYASFFAHQIELGTSIFSFRITDNYFIYETHLPSAFVGRKLKDIDFEREFNLKLITIKLPVNNKNHSEGKYEVIEPSDDYIVSDEDIFVLAGRKKAFINLMKT